MTNTEVFNLLKEQVEICLKAKRKPVRVAINGVEGTGKTVFAESFCAYLSASGLNPLHVSIDGFHFNKDHRYRQGGDSALGYYEDSYDEISFREKVLISSQANPATIVRATHDLETDEYIDIEPVEIQDNTIILTDGAYLFKPNYVDGWDLKVYLKTDFETAIKRGVERDKDALGGVKSAIAKFELRYHKASKMYLKAVNPEQLADVVIDNSDFHNLKIIKNRFAQ